MNGKRKGISDKVILNKFDVFYEYMKNMDFKF